MANEQNLKPFKPGQSGNPNGRPKGKSLTTILRDLLERKINVKDPISGKKTKKTIRDHIGLNLAAKAVKGDLVAIGIVFDRLEGKAVQRNLNADVDPEEEGFIYEFFGLNGSTNGAHRKNVKKQPVLKRKARK